MWGPEKHHEIMLVSVGPTLHTTQRHVANTREAHTNHALIAPTERWTRFAVKPPCQPYPLAASPH